MRPDGLPGVAGWCSNLVETWLTDETVAAGLRPMDRQTNVDKLCNNNARLGPWSPVLQTLQRAWERTNVIYELLHWISSLLFARMCARLAVCSDAVAERLRNVLSM